MQRNMIKPDRPQITIIYGVEKMGVAHRIIYRHTLRICNTYSQSKTKCLKLLSKYNNIV
jgi:hypothetical protein